MNRKEEIDARIETLQEELEKLKKQREWIEKPITERIKTFDDAVEELGIEHPLVKQYMAAANGDESLTRNTFAYIKLQIVAAALNEGWEPQFTKDEWRWFPRHILWNWELSDKKMREEIKTSYHLLLLDGQYKTEFEGLCCVSSFGAYGETFLNFNSCLCLKTQDLATYCGTQFIDIWADYLLPRKK